MKVSIGRIVLIVTVNQGEQITRPAIVVVAHDNAEQAVDVQMFLGDPGAIEFLSEVRHESSAAMLMVEDCFWIWPPRES